MLPHKLSTNTTNVVASYDVTYIQWRKNTILRVSCLLGHKNESKRHTICYIQIPPSPQLKLTSLNTTCLVQVCLCMHIGSDIFPRLSNRSHGNNLTKAMSLVTLRQSWMYFLSVCFQLHLGQHLVKYTKGYPNLW